MQHILANINVMVAIPDTDSRLEPLAALTTAQYGLTEEWFTMANLCHPEGYLIRNQGEPEPLIEAGYILLVTKVAEGMYKVMGWVSLDYGVAILEPALPEDAATFADLDAKLQ